jgi:hypothetical protein
MTRIRRYSHSVEITVDLGAVILVALVVWLCVALAGCGTPATATTAAATRPPQCAALLGQIKAFDDQVTASQKNDDVMSEIGASDAFQLTLRKDAASPAVPQKLWTAEGDLTTALQTMNAKSLNTALYQIKAVCG